MADNFNYNMQIVASQPLDAERLSILRSTIEGALMEYMPGVSVGEVTEEDDSFTEDQIEWMREQLITGGAGGALGSPNQPSYMSAEEVTERYQAMFPGQKVPR